MRIILHYNRKNQTGEAPIQFEVYFSRYDRVYFSPNVKINKNLWDKGTNQVKPDHPDHILLNAQIEAMRKKLNWIGKEYAESGKTLTGELLRIEMEALPPSSCLNDYIGIQIELDRPGLKYSTYKRLKSVLKNLSEFRTITFAQCDTQFIREYHNHLLKTMQQSSTPKNHKVLSKYIRRAINDGLLDKNPYFSFKIPAFAKRKVYLTDDELKRIREKEITIERLQIVRDMFIFMCNTGMEYADMTALTHENIATIEGKKFIVKSRIKVEGEIQAIPIFPEALGIIEKYSTGTGKIFPARSNQRLNSYLKEIGTICGINKELSTIVARHTFATLMLTMGMPLETVSHMMGHSNTKTTRIYAKLVVSKITNDLTRLGIDGI